MSWMSWVYCYPFHAPVGGFTKTLASHVSSDGGSVHVT